MKIAVIGGGSAYCPGLIREILKEAEMFRGCRFVLVDICRSHGIGDPFTVRRNRDIANLLQAVHICRAKRLTRGVLRQDVAGYCDEDETAKERSRL